MNTSKSENFFLDRTDNSNVNEIKEEIVVVEQKLINVSTTQVVKPNTYDIMGILKDPQLENDIVYEKIMTRLHQFN